MFGARWYMLWSKVRIRSQHFLQKLTINRTLGTAIILTLVICNLSYIYRGPPARSYDEARRKPYIFVGGHQSSGTTLMRILLDVHSMVRCGPEPVVGEFFLQFRRGVERFKDRLIDIGLYPDILDSATANFLSEIIERMGEPAPFLCHKDPRTFFYLSYLGELFPNAKFIHMLRDGRAAITSSLSRQLSKGTEYQLLTKWERFVRLMQYECQELGPDRCMSVRYELLVLEPEKMMRKVLDFLGLPWDPKVLEHEKYVLEVSNLTSFDKSTSQVVEKIYTESLGLWAEGDSVLSEKFVETAHLQCPLLRELGYAAVGIPPNYRLLSWDRPYMDWIPKEGDLDPPMPGKKSIKDL